MSEPYRDDLLDRLSAENATLRGEVAELNRTVERLQRRLEPSLVRYLAIAISVSASVAAFASLITATACVAAGGKWSVSRSAAVAFTISFGVATLIAVVGAFIEYYDRKEKKS